MKTRNWIKFQPYIVFGRSHDPQGFIKRAKELNENSPIQLVTTIYTNKKPLNVPNLKKPIHGSVK